MNKKTGELLEILKKEKNINAYITDNAEELVTASLAELLGEMLKKSKKTKAQVIDNANIDKNYAYQMFSGVRKKPARDKLLMLIFGMELSVADSQTLLKRAGYQPLYPRIKRDSIIIFALERRLSLTDTNELLFETAESILE